MNYECFVQPRGFARWVCAAVLAAGAVRGATPTARDYVQTGLVAHWDGLENAGRIYAIRLYERALTADEIRRNARVDRVRFFGAPLPNLTTSIFIR